jgi:hypothetical protein
MSSILPLALSTPSTDERYESDRLDILHVNGHQAEVPSSCLPSTRLPGVMVGRLVDVGDDGKPIVRLPDSQGKTELPARSTLALHRGLVGVEVAILFEDGSREKPIVVGVLTANAPATSPAHVPLDISVDNERLELKADREIVLRCGNASITLTQAGKVLLQGAYVSSRASGVNRIKGGSVQIN